MEFNGLSSVNGGLNMDSIVLESGPDYPEDVAVGEVFDHDVDGVSVYSIDSTWVPLNGGEPTLPPVITHTLVAGTGSGSSRGYGIPNILDFSSTIGSISPSIVNGLQAMGVYTENTKLEVWTARAIDGSWNSLSIIGVFSDGGPERTLTIPYDDASRTVFNDYDGQMGSATYWTYTIASSDQMVGGNTYQLSWI